MTVQMVGSVHRTVAVDIITPAAQLSANADAVVVGSEIDARPWGSLAYTMKVITNAVTWTVFGANSADYSDETAVQAAASVGVGASGSYAVAPAPYSYYRVKIRSTVADVHGTATIVGIAKG